MGKVDTTKMDQQRQVSYFGHQELSRLEDFVARMEAGQPYGDKSDIDMLLDEIVKRLERQVVAKIDEIHINIQQSLTSSPVPTKKSLTTSESSPPIPQKVRKISEHKPSLEPNTDLLNHDAQDFVQDIVMTSMESLINNSLADVDRKAQQESGTVFRPSRVTSAAKKTPRAKYDEETMTRYDEGTERAMMFVATASDEKIDTKSTSRKPAVDQMTGMKVDENITRPIPYGHDGPRYSAKETTTPVLKPKSAIQPQKKSLDTNINTNYTYALRNSVRRAIPKYLQQDDAAMMNVFNAIRVSMAEDSIESIMADVFEEAFSREGEKRKGGEKYVERNLVREKVGTKISSSPCQIQADKGRNYFETRSWSNRERQHTSPGRQTGTGPEKATAADKSKFMVQSVTIPKGLRQDAIDGYAQHEKRVTFKTGQTDATFSGPKMNVLERLGGDDQNINTNYTYSLRSSVKRAIPKYLQQDGGQSKAAMMNVFNAIRFAMADESIEGIMTKALEEAFSRDHDERKGDKRSVERNILGEKAAMKTPGPRKIQADKGRGYFETRSWSNRRPDYTSPGQDVMGGYTQHKMKTGEIDAASRQKMSQNTLSRYVQKGSHDDAVLSMAGSILAEKCPGGWNQEDFDNFFGSIQQGEPSNLNKRQVDFVDDMKDIANTLGSWEAAAKHIEEATMRYDSNMSYHIRKTLRRAVPKFTCNKMVSSALLQLTEKLMDDFPLQSGSAALTNANIEISFEKEKLKDSPRVSRGKASVSKKSTPDDLPWVSKGKDEKLKTNASSDLTWVIKGKNAPPIVKTAEELPWVTKGQNATTTQDIASQDLPWVTKGENVTSKKVTYDSPSDLQWVRIGNTVNDEKRSSITANMLPQKTSIGTQTSLRALYDEYAICPQTVTGGRGWNKNTNQSADTFGLSSEDNIHEEIFYDALTSHVDLQIKPDCQDDEMSFLKRFRLNLLFRKKKTNEKKFVAVVHKVIEARRSGCIDDDGNFVQGFAQPTQPIPTENEGKKSPPPAVKPKPKQSLDQNGNQPQRSTTRKRGSSRRRHNPDRESYPLPEEDDGSEGYASANEMDNFEFNPTAFLERNRRSAENRFHRDDGTDADVESDSDGANSSNRRVRFSDDVQHFGEIVALRETESSDNLDAEDDEPDNSAMSLKSKIELFEKVGSNEFLDERSFQGSPPPDLPENASLPTKDRVQLFEDISSGKKPTTCAKTNKTPRRAVESCQYTQTKSKISFFEQLCEQN